jgi:hypothetical protein
MPEKHFYFSIGAGVGTAMSYVIGNICDFMHDNISLFNAF